MIGVGRGGHPSLSRRPRVPLPQHEPLAVEPLASGDVVAIVGHGRSPEGQRWGETIDSCVTIRMWDCSWQEPVDYGARYDYGLIEAHPGLIRTFKANNRREPAKGWVASALHQAQLCELPPRTDLIDQAPWNEIGKALGGVGATGKLQFTRGTIAALWATAKLCRPGVRIVLVGFDNIRAGIALPIDEAFAPIYRQNPGSYPFTHYKSGVTKDGNHDYSIEWPVMQYMAERRGVTLTFAQDIWL